MVLILTHRPDSDLAGESRATLRVGSMRSAEFVPRAHKHRPLRFGLRNLSAWSLVLVGSAAVLVTAGAVLAAVWLSSTKTIAVSSHTTASLMGIELRVQSGDVAVVGGSQNGVSITSSNHSVFGHGPHQHRSLHRGLLKISSSCPRLVIGSCSASYRVVVPNDVPISVRTERGSIRARRISGLGRHRDRQRLDQGRGLLRLRARRRVGER